jgi:hypothetical protein
MLSQMARDKGVTPDLLGRNFAGSETAGRETIMRHERINSYELARRTNVVARVEGGRAKQRALGALAHMRHNRPLKPPGRV